MGGTDLTRGKQQKAAEVLFKHVSGASNNKMTLTEQRAPFTLQGNNILGQDIVYASLQVLVLEELACHDIDICSILRLTFFDKPMVVACCGLPIKL
jgi:hypothetical protein